MDSILTDRAIVFLIGYTFMTVVGFVMSLVMYGRAGLESYVRLGWVLVLPVLVFVLLEAAF